MTLCSPCGVEYKVKFDDEDAEVQFCPCCGIDVDDKNPSQLELDFGDDE